MSIAAIHSDEQKVLASVQRMNEERAAFHAWVDENYKPEEVHGATIHYLWHGWVARAKEQWRKEGK